MCELDLIFNFQRAYYILDEYILGGEVHEPSLKAVLRAVYEGDERETREVEARRALYQ